MTTWVKEEQAAQRQAKINSTLASIEESLADLELAQEDRGWLMLNVQASMDFSEFGRSTIARNSEIVLAANPMAKQGIRLRTAYIWGGGVSISVADADPEQGGTAQDVNGVVQAFLDRNRDVLAGALAHEEIEAQLATCGEIIWCLVTDMLTGQVILRSIDPDEVTDFISNPQDRKDVWYCKRQYTFTEIGSTTTQTKIVYHPSWDYHPPAGQRLKAIDGNEILWDQPVRAMILNRPLRKSKRGLGDLYPVLPWIRASKEVLEAWVILFKALARYAYKHETRGDRVQQMAQELRSIAQPTARSITDPAPNGAGATYVGGTQATLEAVSKSGAMIDAEGARPVQALVAAGLGLPVTMLLGDPGITGSRATAETLNEPTALTFGMRRDQHAEVLTDLCGYQIDCAIQYGELRGTVKTEGTRWVGTLAGDQDRTVSIVFPDFDSTPIKDKIEAIVNAAAEQVMPKALVLKLILEALKVDDVDEIMDANTDDEGLWIDLDGTADEQRNDNGRSTGVVPRGEEDTGGDNGGDDQGSATSQDRARP